MCNNVHNLIGNPQFEIWLDFKNLRILCWGGLYLGRTIKRMQIKAYIPKTILHLFCPIPPYLNEVPTGYQFFLDRKCQNKWGCSRCHVAGAVPVDISVGLYLAAELGSPGVIYIYGVLWGIFRCLHLNKFQTLCLTTVFNRTIFDPVCFAPRDRTNSGNFRLRSHQRMGSETIRKKFEILLISMMSS